MGQMDYQIVETRDSDVSQPWFTKSVKNERIWVVFWRLRVQELKKKKGEIAETKGTADWAKAQIRDLCFDVFSGILWWEIYEEGYEKSK